MTPQYNKKEPKKKVQPHRKTFQLFIPTTTPPGTTFDISDVQGYDKISITYGKWDFYDLSVLAFYIGVTYLLSGEKSERGHDNVWGYAARNFTVQKRDLTSKEIRSRWHAIKDRFGIFKNGKLRKKSAIKWTKKRFEDNWLYSFDFRERIRKAKTKEELQSLIEDSDKLINDQLKKNFDVNFEFVNDELINKFDIHE